jgi:hypothetical protein
MGFNVYSKEERIQTKTGYTSCSAGHVCALLFSDVKCPAGRGISAPAARYIWHILAALKELCHQFTMAESNVIQNQFK